MRLYARGPATRTFLEALRVWPRLDAARLAPVLDMRVHGDARGRSALRFGAFESAHESLVTIVEHRTLARVLDDAAGYAPGIERIAGIASDVA